MLTIIHDAGTDLKIPRQAASGAGFAVMDGDMQGNAGRIVPAISCQRLDAMHLLLVLQSALESASGACRLYYPYGSVQIGRGNAVTDNFSEIAKSDGWNAAADLGTDWVLDCPLAATFSGITLSDTSS